MTVISACRPDAVCVTGILFNGTSVPLSKHIIAILHRLAGTTPPGGQNVSWTCDHCISSQTTSPCNHIVSWIIRSTALTRSHTKTYHNLRWFNRVIIYGVGHLSVMS